MSDLSPLRAKIDEIDNRLVELLNERAKVVLEIGAFKEKAGLPVYVPEREDLLLRRIEQRNGGPLREVSLRAIYREIMSASLSLEKDLRVVCSGGWGGVAHQAALSKFGSSLKYVFCPEIRDVFLQVGQMGADCGIVPVELAEHGMVRQTLECFFAGDVMVTAEIRSGEASRGDRFFVIGKVSNRPSGNDRSLILLRLADQPGALVHALEPFVKRAVNLHQFASAPVPGEAGELLFFVEADGHCDDLFDGDLHQELGERCLSVRILGSYPCAKNLACDG